MHMKMGEIKKTTTVERIEELSKIWKEVYLSSPEGNIVYITEHFEEDAKEKGFTQKEIKWFLSI